MTIPDTISEISLDDLHDSPFQPRTTYRGLQELADNITAEGRIHQPLLVRPRTAGGFELVFGHRRLRAAELAGLATVPCTVRALSDAEVRSAQMSENVQRDAMQALEEAAGLQAQISEDGISAAELARRIGKSASYVSGRLKLLTLHPKVRDALLAGEIDAESALYVARVGPQPLQEKALAKIASAHLEGDLRDGGRRSTRTIRNLLAEHFTLELDKALFDREDETLQPLAGACSACPKRTGNAPEFDDIANPSFDLDRHGRHRDYVVHAGPDTCTDPDCFAAKKAAHLKRQAAKLAAAGQTVVDGNRARAAIDAHGNVKGAYIAASELKAEDVQLRNAVKPVPVVLQDPRTGKTVKAYKRDDLVAHGVKLAAAKPAQGTAAHYEAERKKREAEHQANERKATEENAVRRVMLDRVRQAIAAKPRTAFDLRILAAMVFESVDWHDRIVLADLHGFKDRHELEKKFGQLDVAALTLFMIDCALVASLEVTPHNLKSKPEVLLAAAAEYGVDLDAVRRELAEGASTPPPAAQATKGTKAAAVAAGAAKPAGGAVKYRCPDTGSTWSGRGLQPVWIKAALASGKTLEQLLAPAAPAKANGKAKAAKTGPAGHDQTDDAGCAGERDVNTADLFEAHP